MLSLSDCLYTLGKSMIALHWIMFCDQPLGGLTLPDVHGVAGAHTSSEGSVTLAMMFHAVVRIIMVAS